MNNTKKLISFFFMVQIAITFSIYVDADLIEDQVETPNNYSVKLKIAKSSSRTGQHKKVGSAASKESLEETPALFNADYFIGVKYVAQKDDKNDVEKKQIAALAKREIKLEVEQVKYIGQRVWLNEGGGKLDSLISWNKGEHHASLGIGHSIWYPLNYTGPSFEESFPNFLKYIEEEGVQLPTWLINERFCPWQTRDEMLQAKKKKEKKYVDLQQLLKETFLYKVEFMTKRLNNAIPKIMNTLEDEEEKNLVILQYDRVSRSSDGSLSPNGAYTLLDYTNFKGEGVKAGERYKGEGWGLLQVLKGMKGDTENPIQEFVDSAKNVLDRRIKNSPAERNEEKWRKGWNNRLSTYLHKIN